MALTTERLREIAEDGFLEHGDAKLMARELLANREAQPVAVTDEMALAFHRALNDGGIGESDIEEIKVGLRGALCNVTAPPQREVRPDDKPFGYYSKETAAILERRGFAPISANPLVDHSIPLYTAPPAPAVPGEMRNIYRAEGLAEVLKDASEYAPLTAKQWETLVNNWHQTFVGLSGDANACRAAMLAAAPAVPEEMTGCIAMSKYKVKKSNYAQWVKGWNACRAAMLNHVGEANEKAAEKCECSSIDYCGDCLRKMSVQPVSQVPDGWVMVPFEPTRQMMSQGHFAMGGTDRGKFRRIYQAMVNAAPEAK